MNVGPSQDLTRTTLGVLIIGVLLVASLWTMQAFIGPLVWATAIVIATWPLLRWVQRKLGGSRALATTVMTLVSVSATALPPLFPPSFVVIVVCTAYRSIPNLVILRYSEGSGTERRGTQILRSTSG